MTIRIKKTKPDATLPVYSSDLAAGADLYACTEKEVRIQPGETALIPTGIAVAIPAGYAGFVFARSGLSVRMGLAPANKVGVIDADYRGEILVSLYNQSRETRTVNHGDRIAQLVILPIEVAAFKEVDELPDTARGAGGFGSTGR